IRRRVIVGRRRCRISRRGGRGADRGACYCRTGRGGAITITPVIDGGAAIIAAMISGAAIGAAVVAADGAAVKAAGSIPPGGPGARAAARAGRAARYRGG